jgi:hypothetical protein
MRELIMIYKKSFPGGQCAIKKRRMNPGMNLGAAFPTPQRKNCNTEVKLRML